MIYLRLLIIGGAFAAGALVAHWYYQSAMTDQYEEALRTQRSEFETILNEYADRINKEAERSSALSMQVKALRDSNADLQEEIANVEFQTETDDAGCRSHPVDSDQFRMCYDAAAEGRSTCAADSGPE